MKMKARRTGVAVRALVTVAVLAAVALTTSLPRPAPDRPVGVVQRPKEAVLEHSRGLDATQASSEAVENRAYPRGYVESSRALQAKHAFERKPDQLKRSDFRSAAAAAAATTLAATWQELGPFTPKVPAEVTYTGVPTLNSGRVTALAVDPNCGAPHKGCRLWVAAAGGGVWRTGDALAAAPRWTNVSTGLDSLSTGSLFVDTTDPTGNTVYLGTGEPNGSTDSEAGIGLYRTTDGGDHWAPVTGSFAVAHDRSIGAIAVDPRNSRHIFIGTDLARHGHSSTYGGRRTPPNAPTLGLYESTDGGQTFTLAFSRPGSPVDPAAGTGADFFQGGVNHIELDPSDPSTVYAAFFGYGIWRRSARLDRDTAFHQVFATRNPADTFGDRTEFALASLDNGHTRIYAGDSSDDEGISELWRTDNADRPANRLTNGKKNLNTWILLSNPTNGTPGYTSYNYCQGQCGYDDPVAVDPSDPDTVWLAGQMAYDEIPGAEGGTPRSFGRAVVRSTNAGVSFTDMTEDAGNEGLHPDNHFIAFDPFNPAWAFIGSDGGVARIDGAYVDRSGECASRHLAPADLADCQRFLSSTPRQIDAINDGLATLQFQDFAINPNDPNDILGGTQDNGTWTGPANWFESIGGDGGPAAIGLDGVRQHTYTGTTGDVNFHGNDPRTWDYNTWPMDISGELSAFYSPLIADPVTPGTMFEGMQHVWRTLDNGGDQEQLDAHCRNLDPLGNLPAGDRSIVCGDWEPIGPDLTAAGFGDRAGQYMSQVQRAPSDAGTMWASTRLGRVWVSKNSNAADPSAVTFKRIDSATTPGRFPSGISIDPADANHAWISYSGYNAYTPATPGHVFEVRFNPATGTGTFTDRSYDLGDQPITDVQYDPATKDLYAATDFGVLRLPAGATAWERAGDGLPPVAVYGLTLASGARTMIAATHGRGAYRITLPTPTRAPVASPGAGATTTPPATTPASQQSGGGVLGAQAQSFAFARVSAKRHGARYVALRWTLPRAATVRVRLFNERGKLVATRTVKAHAGRAAVTAALRRGTRVVRGHRWRLELRATDAAGKVTTKRMTLRV
jgi:hypothetical protein